MVRESKESVTSANFNDDGDDGLQFMKIASVFSESVSRADVIFYYSFFYILLRVKTLL